MVYLHNTYLVLKKNPKISIGHPLFCQRELYYHGINNIITKQDSWHKAENNTQSLPWHIGQTYMFMHNFISLHSKLINFWALQLPAFLLSSWAIDATKERSGCTCTCQQKKKIKQTHERLDSSMLQLLFQLSTVSPPSMLQLLLPQHPCDVTQMTPPS